MDEKELLQLVENYSKDNSDEDDIHGFGHVQRVYQTCIKIGKKTDADLFILRISSLLHDIGRKNNYDHEKDLNHANISAQMTQKFLTSINYEFSNTQLENINHTIEAHSFSNQVIPKTLEAKILSDADKLDALGAIGLYRTIGFTIKNGGNLYDVLEHLENKIMILKTKLYLNISKEMAKKKEKIIISFYDEIKKNQ